MSENQKSNVKETKEPKKTAQDKKMELAAERGSLVLIPNSGDEMYSLIFLLRQLDNALTRMNKGSRTYKDADVSAFKKEVRDLTDKCNDLTERACEYVGFNFRIPAPLEHEKNIQNVIDKKK